MIDPVEELELSAAAQDRLLEISKTAAPITTSEANLGGASSSSRTFQMTERGRYDYNRPRS